MGRALGDVHPYGNPHYQLDPANAKIIGRNIVEQEQKGSARAGYGEELVIRLSRDLQARFGRGFGRANLFQMKAFFLAYRDIVQTGSGLSGEEVPRQTVQTASGLSVEAGGLVPVAARFRLP